MSLAHHDVNTFSPEGRIIQVEYAMKAMNLGTTSIAVRLEDCVILVSEKKLVSPLQNSQSIRKHFKIYDRICASVSGISGDAPSIIQKCVSKCINHEKIFNEQMPVENLIESLCSLALKFSENDIEKKIFSRPFGVSILIAAFERGPKLFSIDPSGSYLGYKAKAIGLAQEVVNQTLEKEYPEFVERETSIKKIVKMLKKVMREPLTQNNIEVTIVDQEGVLMLTPQEILNYIE